VDARLPLTDEFLATGSGSGTQQAVEALEWLADNPGTPAWLRPRAAAVAGPEASLHGEMNADAVPANVSTATAVTCAGIPTRW
jgi:hypothetical protein